MENLEKNSQILYDLFSQFHHFLISEGAKPLWALVFDANRLTGTVIRDML
jgi:hypothetical protein